MAILASMGFMTGNTAIKTGRRMFEHIGAVSISVAFVATGLTSNATGKASPGIVGIMA